MFRHFVLGKVYLHPGTVSRLYVSYQNLMGSLVSEGEPKVRKVLKAVPKVR